MRDTAKLCSAFRVIARADIVKSKLFHSAVSLKLHRRQTASYFVMFYTEAWILSFYLAVLRARNSNLRFLRHIKT